jgi:hypothetical protein
MLSWFENGQFEVHEKTGAPVDQDSPGRMVGFNDELPQMLERAAATADAELWAKAGEKFVFGIDPAKGDDCAAARIDVDAEMWAGLTETKYRAASAWIREIGVIHPAKGDDYAVTVLRQDEKIVFSEVNDPNVWPPSEFCGIVDAMRGNRQTENKTAIAVRLAQEQAEHQLRAMQAQAQRAVKERWNNELLAKKIEWPAPATDAEVRGHFKQLALGKVSMAEAEAFEPRLMARRRENEAKGR